MYKTPMVLSFCYTGEVSIIKSTNPHLSSDSYTNGSDLKPTNGWRISVISYSITVTMPSGRIYPGSLLMTFIGKDPWIIRGAHFSF